MGKGMAQALNLEAYRGNDAAFTVDTPLDLADPASAAVLTVYLKSSSSASDSTATTLAAAAGAPGSYDVTFTVPHTDTAVTGTRWWRLDMEDGSGNVSTALYGNFSVIPV